MDTKPDPTADPTDPTDPTSVGSVTDIADAQVDLDLDAVEQAPPRPPFTFRLGGRGWSVPAPGVAQTLDAEQAPFLSDFFEILMGEDLWDEFEPVFRAQTNPDLTWKLGRGMSLKFGMDPASVERKATADQPGNRFQRRQARRAQPRR